MEHLKRDATRFEVYDTAHAVAQQNGLTFVGKDELKQVVQHMEQSLLKETQNPAMYYGLLNEARFSYVAAALGKTVVVKREDAGTVISSNTTMKVPDYRLVVAGGDEFFVEVKNKYEKLPKVQHTFTDAYFSSLEAYAAAFSRPLKFAIYWSPLNLWTLISADKLPFRNGKRAIGVLDAAKINEMAILGDMTIATKVPLTLRLLSDTAEPSTLSAEGEARFKIGGVELFCDGERLSGEDCKLAWYMMLYGQWSELNQIPYMDGKRLIALDYIISPEVWEPKQGFAIIGQLSGMISRQFQQHTDPDGKQKLIRPLAEPGKFGISIPDGYKSDRLPLWRFTIEPNYA